MHHARTAGETKNRAGGWSWLDPPTADICDSAYGFKPNWLVCGADWQVDFQGFIKLEKGGQHCFRAAGDTNGACGSLFFNGATSGVTPAANAQCFNVAAGVYPIRWFYETAGAPKTMFRAAYCFGGAQTCEPTEAVPTRLLRTQHSPGDSVCDPNPTTCSELCKCGPGCGPCARTIHSVAVYAGGEPHGGALSSTARASISWPPGKPGPLIFPPGYSAKIGLAEIGHQGPGATIVELKAFTLSFDWTNHRRYKNHQAF